MEAEKSRNRIAAKYCLIRAKQEIYSSKCILIMKNTINLSSLRDLF